MTTIQDERLKRSMTQKRLAYEAGIDARTLRKIEKGEKVSPESTLAVCTVLGIDPKTIRPDKTPSSTSSPEVIPPSEDPPTPPATLVTSSKLLALAPFAFTLAAGAVSCLEPRWMPPSLLIAVILAALFAAIADLPTLTRPRPLLGGAIVIALGATASYWDFAQYDALWTKPPLFVMGIGALLLLPEVRRFVVPMRGGEPNFERLLILMILWESLEFSQAFASDFGRFSFRDIWFPGVSLVSAFVIPFRHLRPFAFIAVGVEHAIYLPDFPVQLFYGGGSRISPVVLVELSLDGIAWCTLIGLMSFAAAVPYGRVPLRRYAEVTRRIVADHIGQRPTQKAMGEMAV